MHPVNDETSARTTESASTRVESVQNPSEVEDHREMRVEAEETPEEEGYGHGV